MEPAGWLTDEDYAWARGRLPIACVDVLVFRDAPSGRELGLIVREAAAGRRGYALIGGRVLHGELLREALERHVALTLGDHVRLGPVDPSRPLGAFEYFPDGRDGLVDPDKHAVALTYAALLEGTPEARGEAVGFEWFAPDRVPAVDEFLFGHGRVVRQLLGDVRG